MDYTNSAPAGLDLSKLSEKDKHELQQFVINEAQKTRIQQSTSLLFPLFLDL